MENKKKKNVFRCQKQQLVVENVAELFVKRGARACAYDERNRDEGGFFFFLRLAKRAIRLL